MKKQINNKELKAVDFFCSGGGMSYGLTMAGINVLAGIDIDISCKATYEANLPNSKFIHADIKKYSVKELGKAIEIRQNDDSMIFIGCSPCQYWTKINTIKAKSHKTKNLLEDFKRFVDFFNPGYIVIENVPGILSKKKESGLDAFLENLENRNYAVEFKVINFNYYGVPQSRKRFTLIATRIGNKKLFPMQETEYKPVVKDFIGENNGFYRIPAGHRDNTDFMHTASLLSEKNLQRIGLTPENGGNRLSWANSVLQLNTYKRLGNNSFKDVYGRMSWDKPAPTITTKFVSLSNGRFGHPEENRAISIREGATLQTFPKDFIFKTTSIGMTARLIGNAVPPEYAKRIGLIIKGSNEGEN